VPTAEAPSRPDVVIRSKRKLPGAASRAKVEAILSMP
jgi:hypothetical protein